jgi:hypothetical protein
MKEGLTEQEKVVLEATASVWNEYLKLEEVHPDERDEVKFAIHQIQHLVARRVARRVDPNIWN